MKFRRRPTIVEAEQYRLGLPCKGVFDAQTPHPWVETIHLRPTEVEDGDWIVTEPDGRHHYPVKPDIFSETYEAVE